MFGPFPAFAPPPQPSAPGRLGATLLLRSPDPGPYFFCGTNPFCTARLLPAPASIIIFVASHTTEDPLMDAAVAVLAALVGSFACRALRSPEGVQHARRAPISHDEEEIP